MEQTQAGKRAVANAINELLGLKNDANIVGEVVRLGNKVVIPKDASIPEVISVLERQHESEHQTVKNKASVAVPPWDGSIALTEAISEVLGIVLPVGTPGFFGDHPPEEIEVEVSLGKTEKIRWGRFLLPGMGEDAFVQCGTTNIDGMLAFEAIILCRRLHEERAKRILQRMREIAAIKSLHKGKAFSLTFTNDEGHKLSLPTPRFFPISSEVPIFNRDLELSIERNIFLRMRKPNSIMSMGESLKYGVVFAGRYGTGKTMLASHIARESEACGWTFMYVKDSKELQLALQYAQRFQPIVVFVEDIDRVGGANRTNSVNELLNQLDGIDSKASQIITVMTTNHPEQINEAMKRPGRVDLLLAVEPPDADATHRMIAAFGRGGIEDGTDLSDAIEVLKGHTPAFVREALSRARLEALRRTGEASKINGADLALTAREVVAEREKFSATKPEASETLTGAELTTAFKAAAAAYNKPLGKANGALRV